MQLPMGSVGKNDAEENNSALKTTSAERKM
jgi:hypothetical protein